MQPGKARKVKNFKNLPKSQGTFSQKPAKITGKISWWSLAK